MSQPCAILVDDEPELLAMLRRRLAEVWPDLRIVGEAGEGAAALALAAATRPDVAFLDIQMPGPSGLEVARQLGGQCHVVFVTAHDQYALTAFERAAVDYVVKPVTAERLAVTVERLKGRLTTAPPSLDELLARLATRLPAQAPQWLQWLQVQRKRDLVLVAVEDVALFTSADKYTLAVARDGEWVIRTPLKELEAQLDPERFWRVHRSAIVRVASIDRVTRDDDGELTVHLKGVERPVAVSRAHAGRFRQM